MPQIIPIDYQFVLTLFEGWLGGFMLIFARNAGLISRMPVLSEPSIPALVKTALIVAFSLLSCTFVKIPSIDWSHHNFFIEMLKNFALGYLIGFISNLVINIVQVAGEVVDVQTGLNSSVVMTGGVQSTIFNTMLKSWGILIILYFGGLEFVLLSLKQSYQFFPIMGGEFSRMGLDMADIVKYTGNVMVLGIITASPVLVVIVFTDIVLAIMSRAAQQINPFQLSYSVKPILGMLILLFCLPLMNNKIIKLSQQGTDIYQLSQMTSAPSDKPIKNPNPRAMP